VIATIRRRDDGKMLVTSSARGHSVVDISTMEEASGKVIYRIDHPYTGKIRKVANLDRAIILGVKESQKRFPESWQPKVPTATTVTVRRRIPDNELTTEQLVQRIKSEHPSEAQALYGRFVKARDLKPEIDAREFIRLLNSVSPNEHVVQETVPFKPTHFDLVTQRAVQITQHPRGYFDILWSDGMTGSDPAGQLSARFSPIPQEATIGTYRYRLTSTGDSSAKYGNCEVCNKYASEMFRQSEERAYDDDGQVGWTQHGCRNLFGHKECLLAQRRDPLHTMKSESPDSPPAAIPKATGLPSEKEIGDAAVQTAGIHTDLRIAAGYWRSAVGPDIVNNARANLGATRQSLANLLARTENDNQSSPSPRKQRECDRMRRAIDVIDRVLAHSVKNSGLPSEEEIAAVGHSGMGMVRWSDLRIVAGYSGSGDSEGGRVGHDARNRLKQRRDELAAIVNELDRTVPPSEKESHNYSLFANAVKIIDRVLAHGKQWQSGHRSFRGMSDSEYADIVGQAVRHHESQYRDQGITRSQFAAWAQDKFNLDQTSAHALWQTVLDKK
jgi:hypothetical protein